MQSLGNFLRNPTLSNTAVFMSLLLVLAPFLFSAPVRIIIDIDEKAAI